MREVPSHHRRRVARRGLAGALLLCGASLAGCGTTNLHNAAIDEADAHAAAIFADCNNQLAAGKLRSYRQAVACARDPVLMAYAQAGFPFMDLILFDLQERDIGASRIDEGLAQPADVQRDIATLEQRLMDERDRRVAARSGIGGAVPTALPQQLLAGLTSLQPRALPTQDNACFTVGDFKRCSSQSDRAN
jgi:hypothetical protein